jgi:phosphate transport system substrate-binding protein
MMKHNLLHLLLLIIALFSGCGDALKSKYDDTPTSGNVPIVVDESYEPLVGVELDTFMKLYKYATVRPSYLPESEVFKRLLNDDSVRIAIVSRELNEQEKAAMAAQKIVPRNTKVAVDAVALVINNQNPDSQLVYNQLSAIIRGDLYRWNQLNPGGLSDSIRVVFDKSGSANTRFLKETFLGDREFPKNCFATNSNAAVIDYVSQTRGAIGVVGVNWISDREDEDVERFLSKVRVVELSSREDSIGNEYFGPFQAYIALKKYPLIRDVIIISREGRNGLGTGFASFFAGDQGQRLVRLSGMLPANMPVRIIKISE